jgi:hypothetical protein
VELLREEPASGATGPSGPARTDLRGEYTLRITGPTGPSGAIKTVKTTNKKIEKLLKPLLVAFENTSTYVDHYRVQRAKASMIITKGVKGKAEVSFLIHLGGEGKYERAAGIEVEIERHE